MAVGQHVNDEAILRLELYNVHLCTVVFIHSHPRSAHPSGLTTHSPPPATSVRSITMVKNSICCYITKKVMREKD
ncbi:hypothetical protein J6590_075805 [Homalodisca vitripennis]|nr:hypothetical protein J6590_075805 [Homalodisca vitripennis]